VFVKIIDVGESMSASRRSKSNERQRSPEPRSARTTSAQSIVPEILQQTDVTFKIIGDAFAELGSFLNLEELASTAKNLSESIKTESLRIEHTDGLLSESYAKFEVLLKEQTELNTVRTRSLERVKELKTRYMSVTNSIKNIEKSKHYYEYCKNIFESKPENTTVWFLSNDACPICMEVNNKCAKLNHCQHLVCEHCIYKMLNVNPAATCPICREPIISYEVFDTTLMRNKYIINNITDRNLDGMVEEDDESNSDPDLSIEDYIPNIIVHGSSSTGSAGTAGATATTAPATLPLSTLFANMAERRRQMEAINARVVEGMARASAAAVAVASLNEEGPLDSPTTNNINNTHNSGPTHLWGVVSAVGTRKSSKPP